MSVMGGRGGGIWPSHRESVREWKGIDLKKKTRKVGRKGGREVQSKDEKREFSVARDMNGLELG